MVIEENRARIVVEKGDAPTGMLEYGLTNRPERIRFFHRAFRDKIYRHKEAAPLREYGTNAQDAHLAAGTPNRPIEVALPTSLSPQIRIRDYGPSLDDEGMAIFCTYFESTKDQNEQANGCLGLGSKAAFAIGSSFSVHRYLNGEKTVFQSYIDEEDRNKMIRLPSEKTDEPNGIEIVIPVDSDKIQSFIDAAKRVYRHFDPLPAITNCAEISDYLREWTDRKPKSEGVLSSGATWKLFDYDYRQNHYASCVVMANVAYPIDEMKVIDTGALYSSAEYRILASNRLEIHAPTGSVNFTLSREDLEYDQKTLVFLKDALSEIKAALIEEAKAKIDAAKTLWEAMEVRNDLRSNSPVYVDLDKSGVTWRGRTLPFSSIPVKDLVSEKDGEIRLFSYGRTAKGLSKVEAPSASPNAGTPIYYRMKGGKYVRAKVLTALDLADRDALYLFECENEAALAALRKSADLPQDKMLDLEAVKEDPAYLPAKKAKEKSSRRTGKAFSFIEGACIDKNSDAWEDAEVDFKNGSGVYVRIKRFEPVGDPWEGYGWALKINSLLKKARESGVDVPVIYGFRESAELGEGWEPLQEWATRTAASLLETHKEAILATRALARVDYFYKNLAHIDTAWPEGPFAEFMEEIASALHEKEEIASSAIAFANRAGVGEPEDLKSGSGAPDYASQEKAIEKAYPMLGVIRDSYRRIDGETLEEFKKYLKAVQSFRKEDKCD